MASMSARGTKPRALFVFMPNSGSMANRQTWWHSKRLQMGFLRRRSNSYLNIYPSSNKLPIMQKKEEKKMPLAPSSLVKLLMEKGVSIPLPSSVYVDPQVNPEMVSGKGVIIHPGCRIYGSKTVIMEGCVIGGEGPVSIRNCQLGKGVKLGSGSFEGSCFLDGAAMGPEAHVRECCLLEEGARGAHSVGIKHTILFPFVTLGSLINFCDCLMAGGTDAKNHSEVGSSYIHFNYTPNQDKATASLIGDVPRGVMLNQAPIFLGGQGGLVGPVRIGYGVVVAAGTIVRKDLLEENMVLLGHPSVTKKVPRRLGVFPNIKRIIEMNTVYIGNLIALHHWYVLVRKTFLAGTRMGEAIYNGAIEKIQRAINERIKRLQEVAERMQESIKILSTSSPSKSANALIQKKTEFRENWPRVRDIFEKWMHATHKDTHYERFLQRVEHAATTLGEDYIQVIKSLAADETSEGTNWLQGIVDRVTEEVWAALPSFHRRTMG